MAILPGVLGCHPLRRTVQVGLGTNPAVAQDGCQVTRPSPWSRDGNAWNIRGNGLMQAKTEVNEKALHFTEVF
jgi:hypothetical protein